MRAAALRPPQPRMAGPAPDEPPVPAKEFVRRELDYLLDDQKRSGTLLNEIERNTLLSSAALYSFVFTRESLPAGPHVAIALLPLLVTLLCCLRFIGIRERMRRVDARIRAIEAAAGVAGWWSDDYARISATESRCAICAVFMRAWRSLRPDDAGAGQAALVSSRDVYWALSIMGTAVFSLLAIVFI